ncbi:MAG: hypothetical protein HFH05_11910 [Lachnospiraceae bacterium]|nr:hypothetical protein [Lachnospiraceae bacterium]
MLVCVAGKNNIGTAVLDYLYDNCRGRYSLCVVCNKTETGENGWQRSLRLRAGQLGVEECSLEDLYEAEDLLFLSMEFDRLVKTGNFKSDRLYNIHFSLLPAYKGMYTSAQPILNNEKYSGVTLHKIDDGIDTGDIVAQKKFEILDSYNCRDLYLAYIENGTRLVLENIETLLCHKETCTPQASRLATYYSRKTIDYSDIRIDLRQTAWDIRQQVKAFSFREYQLPVVAGHSVIDAEITDAKSVLKPGETVEEQAHSIKVAAIDYDIVLHFDRFGELMAACRDGNEAAVREICRVRRHINEVSPEGWTPLITAAYHGNTECVEALLELGADPFMKGRNGTNLLMYAKDAYWKTGDLHPVDIFLEAGISPGDKDYSGHDLFHYIRENKVDEGKKKALLEHLAAAGSRDAGREEKQS